MDREETGIIELDKLLYGGLLRNKVFLISGEAGTGKTIFSLQFLHTGLKKGESAIYVVVQEKPSDILADAKSMYWDLGNYVKHKKLLLLDTSPYFVKTDHGEKNNIHRMVNDLFKYVRESKAKRLVIDEFAFLAYFGAESEKETQEHIRNLILSLQNNLGCTVIITSSVPIHGKRARYLEIEDSLVSGIIDLAIEETPDLRRTIFIRKMRETNIPLMKHSFSIVPERGIVFNGTI